MREQDLFELDGRRMVRFVIEHGPRGQLRHAVETEVIAEREVTDSGGHREPRVFIRTPLAIAGGPSWPIEINLTQRRNMLFPMLLGRTAMRRRCLVDPARSFLLGRPADPWDPRMKLAILSRNSKLYSTQRLVAAARERGHTVRVLDPLRCYMKHRAGRRSSSTTRARR